MDLGAADQLKLNCSPTIVCNNYRRHPGRRKHQFIFSLLEKIPSDIFWKENYVEGSIFVSKSRIWSSDMSRNNK